MPPFSPDPLPAYFAAAQKRGSAPMNLALNLEKECHPPFALVRALRQMSVKPNQGFGSQSRPQATDFYDRAMYILRESSQSSQLLSAMGLLSMFNLREDLLSFTLAPSGSTLVTLESSTGFRRIIIFHPTGRAEQKVTSPHYCELVSFSDLDCV